MDVDEHEPTTSSRGNEIAQRFELSAVTLFGEILDSVRSEDIVDILAPLPTLNAEKVKKKFNELVEEAFSSQLSLALNEEAFRGKLNLLANLEDSTPKTAATWRPTEDLTADTLYRPYRVQFLKKEIASLKDQIHSEEVKIDVKKSQLSKFLSLAEEVQLKCNKNKKELDEISNWYENENTLKKEELALKYPLSSCGQI